MVKNPPANVGDTRDVGSVPGLGRSPEIGNGDPLQDSCLENPMDRGGWWATVHGVAKSQIRLKRLPHMETQRVTETQNERGGKKAGEEGAGGERNRGRDLHGEGTEIQRGGTEAQEGEKRHREKSVLGQETDKSQHEVTRETDPLPRHTQRDLERWPGRGALCPGCPGLQPHLSASLPTHAAGAQVPGLPTGFPEAVPQLCPQREYPPSLSPLSHQASA